MKVLKSIETYLVTRFHPQRYISPELLTLLLVQGVFLLGVGLSSTFINIFLWKVEHDLSTVLIFNIFQFISVAATFVIAGGIAKRISLTFNLKAGIICYSILFVILLMLQKNAAQYAWALGIMVGVSTGFYYSSYNVLIFDFSTDKNRDLVMSVNGFVFSIAALVAPFAAGFLIESVKGVKGYILVFSISLVLFVIAGVLSSRIVDNATSRQYYLKSVVFMPFRKREWTFIMLGESLRGFREGVMIFLGGVLVYSIINSEMFVGFYTMVCSAVQIASFYFLAKAIRPTNRKRFLLIGASAMCIVSTVFLKEISITTLFIYGIGTAIFTTFINNTTSSIIYWVIHKMPGSEKRRIEGIVVREAYLDAGRIAGVALVLVVPHDMKSIAFVIFLLGLSQVLMYYLFSKVKTE